MVPKHGLGPRVSGFGSLGEISPRAICLRVCVISIIVPFYFFLQLLQGFPCDHSNLWIKYL